MAISCIIISYNSSSTILETLNSVLNQTFKDFELIISDDCSTDDTLLIVSNWISDNSSIIKNVKLIKSDSNLGISQNILNGVKYATNDWVKLLAADDILLPNALEIFYNQIVENMNISFFYSKIIPFNDENLIPQEIENYIIKADRISTNCKDAKEQYKELQKFNFVFSPGIFYNKKILNESDFIDLDIPLLDDYPFFINLTKSNIYLKYIDIPLVKYRISEKSVQRSEEYFYSYSVFYIKYLRKSSLYKLMIMVNKLRCPILSKVLFHFIKLV